MNSLQSFELGELAPYTREGALSGDIVDFMLLEVGVDDVHGALVHLFSRVHRSMQLTMFGYDDESLNDLVMKLVADPAVTTMITLDKSQAGGLHEKKLLDADRNAPGGLGAFNSHFAIGQSETHQIAHTKGGVLDGIVAFEGSTNWSAGGEGTFVVKGQPGGVGYKAQNNTLGVFLTPSLITRFSTRLSQEHAIAQAQQNRTT